MGAGGLFARTSEDFRRFISESSKTTCENISWIWERFGRERGVLRGHVETLDRCSVSFRNRRYLPQSGC